MEYETEGIVQVNVRDDVGLTFEAALRSFLRHDPDKILVGELRDSITAKVAIQAALTGHLVLGTLHTNDAPSAVTRLVDMGLDTYLIADTVRGILAQRLMRRICEKCRTEAVPSKEERGLMEKYRISHVYYGKGCPACHNTGYSGRLGIFEWLPISAEIRQAIRQKTSLEELQKIAQQQGLIPLRDAAVEILRNGQTTIREFLKI